MIIQCPRCSTRWRVGDPAATDNPVFKCGRCHNVFPQFPGAPPASGANGPKAREAPPEPDNLEFIFPRRGHADAGHDAIAPLRDIVHDAPQATAEGPRGNDAPTDDVFLGSPDDEALLDAPDDDAQVDASDDAALAASDTSPFVAAHVHTAADDDADVEGELEAIADDIDLADGVDVPIGDVAAGPTTIDDESDEFTLGRDDDEDDDAVFTDALLADRERPSPSRVVDVEAAMRASARTPAFRPATRFLLVLVVAFALLAVLLRANPARTEAWLGRIPLVGGKLAADAVLGRRITLSSVQGGYQRLRTGRRIFVISGKATNNALVPVERIEVEGALYAASGNVDRKVISTGNKTTLKLRDLTESEIALLQRLDARQPVAPGGCVDFAIVFLEPPRDLREFSSRVLTVRSTGRASDPAGPLADPASVG